MTWLGWAAVAVGVWGACALTVLGIGLWALRLELTRYNREDRDHGHR